MKWLLLILAGLLALAGGFVVYGTLINAPADIQVIIEQPDSDLAARAMVLELPDGRSIPVNYLHEGNHVYVGADGRWWRDLLDQPQVTMLIKGQSLTGSAQVILHDQALTDEIFARLRPTTPTWLPDALNGKLIVITLQD